jgi:hypothetical protein
MKYLQCFDCATPAQRGPRLDEFPDPQASVFSGTAALLEQRVDKRGKRRPLREYDQSAEQNHDEDYWRKPKLLSLSHEGPQVCQKI